MPFQLYILISFSIGFSIVLFTIPKIIKVSNAKKLFDVPNERSAAINITPNLGGIAIFSGFYISSLITLFGFDVNKISALLLSTLIMFLMGLKDDMIGLSPRKKLIGQIFVALFLFFAGGTRINNLHGILGINEIDVVSSFILTLITIIGLVNAYNLIDGIDGLASGTGTLISVVFGILFYYAGQLEHAIFAFSITGCLIAFFFYNVFGIKNKIFMGDTGSLTLGIIFSVFSIWFLESLNNPVFAHYPFASPAVLIALMILPVVDTLRVIFIRIMKRKSPFSPDMNHIHHQMIRLNKSHLNASMTLIFANLCFVLFAMGFTSFFGDSIMFFLILTLGFTLAYLPVWLNRHNLQKVISPANTEDTPILHLHSREPKNIPGKIIINEETEQISKKLS